MQTFEQITKLPIVQKQSKVPNDKLFFKVVSIFQKM